MKLSLHSESVADLVRTLAQGDPVALCARLAEGRGGVAKIPVPSRRSFWVVSNPEAVRQVLVTSADKYDKGGPFYATIAKALGSEGLFTVNDPETWSQLNAAMRPAFSRASIGAAIDQMVPLCDKRMNGWLNNVPIHLFDQFRQLNTEMLMAHMLGVADFDTKYVARLASQVFAGMAGRIFLPRWAPGGEVYHRRIARLMAEIDSIIVYRRACPSSGDDLLGRLMASKEPRFSNKQLREQVVTMLMAGHDSTATLLAWALIRLSKRPELYAQLQCEVDEVLGDLQPTQRDVQCLGQLQRFVRTVAHDRPAFPLFPRNANQLDILGVHTIRPGDQLVVAPSIMHHDASVWKGFDDFYVRLEQGLTREERMASLPFGAGRRKCIGEDLAMSTAITVLAMFLQRFQVPERLAGHSREQIRFAMTAPPKDGALMRAVRR